MNVQYLMNSKQRYKRKHDSTLQLIASPPSHPKSSVLAHHHIKAPRVRQTIINRLFLTFFCIETAIVLCFMHYFLALDPLQSQAAHLEEILNLLGCSTFNLEDLEKCRQAALKCASRQHVLSQQLAKHRNASIQRALQGPIEYDHIRIFRENHPVLVPLDPQFKPRPEWNVDVAIPDIAIVGLAKAGTTQLWNLLTSHPNATHYGESDEEVVKERCLPYEWGEEFGFDEGWEREVVNVNQDRPTEKQWYAQRSLWSFYEQVFFDGEHQRSKTKGLLTVNGCYHIWDVEITRHYLLPFAKKKNQKYIVLFRDPADLLWSAFNFWKIPGWDRGDEGWAEESEHYRSPELFHELLLTENKTMWWGNEVEAYRRRESVINPRKLLGMFSTEHVLFLRNEDMLPSVVTKRGGMLDRLSEFTGLERRLFDETVYSTVRNCNDNAMKSCGTSRHSAYQKSGGREMLPESRTLIYLHFLEECKIWAQDFGIEYPACLNVLADTA